MALTLARITALILLALAFAAPVAARDDAGVPVAVERVPIEVSYYDPAEGGINCLNPPEGCAWLGNGEKFSAAHYWQRAACPPQWIGATVVLDHDEVWGEFFCSEGGGAIYCGYSGKSKRNVCRVDILAPGMWWTGLVYHWRLVR